MIGAQILPINHRYNLDKKPGGGGETQDRITPGWEGPVPHPPTPPPSSSGRVMDSGSRYSGSMI